MIKKIHEIRGVGRFKDFESEQGVELGRLTLIYAENGQGKSTLADIFRSLASLDSARLRGRLTEGAVHQFVKLTTDSGISCFQRNSWNKACRDIQIFDEIFVYENVYEGMHVTPKQRERLHEIVVGEEWVRQVKREETLVAERRKLTTERKRVEGEITSSIRSLESRSGFQPSLDEFLAIRKVGNIDTQIAEQEKRVKQLVEQKEILELPRFASCALPVLPILEFRELLAKELRGLSADATEALQRHTGRFRDNGMTDWIRQGVQYRSDDTDACPFCGQSLQGLALIEHYQTIFAETYQAFETELARFVSRSLNLDEQIVGLRQVFDTNRERERVWTRHIPELNPMPAEADGVVLALAAALAVIKDRLERKQRNPLKSVRIDSELEQALTRFGTSLELAKAYDDAVNSNNQRIEELRVSLKNTDLIEATRQLDKLHYTRLRHKLEVSSICRRYRDIQQEWADKDKAVKKQQRRTKAASRTTFNSFGTSLNLYLRRLGVNVEVHNFKETRSGAVLRADYGLRLTSSMNTGRASVIPLGKLGIDVSQRSFRNVLSEGDKRSLALAFFLARVDSISALKDKTFIFDDPVSSLDDNRRNWTIKELDSLSKDAGQVIVLSHRKQFLHSMWERFRDSARRGIESQRLCIMNSGDGVRFDEWDSEAAVATEDQKRRIRVLDFLRGDSSREVDEISRDLRPLLEYHYKVTYPGLVSRYKMYTLGDIVRNLDPRSSDLVLKTLAESDKETLYELNIVHRESHHGQVPAPEPITEAELRRDCEIVMGLLGRRDFNVN